MHLNNLTKAIKSAKVHTHIKFAVNTRKIKTINIFFIQVLFNLLKKNFAVVKSNLV